MVARNRVVLSGPLGTTEVWSTGLTFMGQVGGADLVSGPEDLDLWASRIATALPSLVTGFLSNALSSSGALTRVDCYHYGESGPATSVGTRQVTGVVGGSNALHPFQTCAVFSLRSGLAGASRRGRSYWPAVGADINAGLFSGSGLSSVPTTFASLLFGIAETSRATEPIGAVVPAVYSPTLNAVTEVTRVEFDTVPDVQRRRADALTGVRYASPVTPFGE